MSLQLVAEHINDRIHNKRWFTARWLDLMSQRTGWPPDLLAKLVTLIVVVYCCFSENAQYLADLILIAYPIIVVYRYPKEAPNKDVLLAYWSLFGCLSLVDHILKNVPAYYVLKIVVHLVLFAQHFKLDDCITGRISSLRESLKRSRKAKSSRKQESDDESAASTAETAAPEAPPEIYLENQPQTAEDKAKIPTVVGTATTCEAQRATSKEKSQASAKAETIKSTSKQDDRSSSTKTAKSNTERSQNDSLKTVDSINASLDRMALDATAIQLADEERKWKQIAKNEVTSASKNSSKGLITGDDIVSQKAKTGRPKKNESNTSVYLDSTLEKPQPTALSTAHSVSQKTTLSVKTAKSVEPHSPSPLSTNDMPDLQRHRGANAMETDRSHALTPNAPTPTQSLSERQGKPHELQTEPAKKLIFNAPLDFDNITYHMRVRNTGKQRIAFAIKGNSVPRVMAYPPSGIIDPGKKLVIAVTVKKFTYDPEKHKKDRIAFDYTLLDAKHDHTKTFNHKLLYEANQRRRRNIHIDYNL